MPGTVRPEHVIAVDKWIAENASFVRQTIIEPTFTQAQIDDYVETNILPPLSNEERLGVLLETRQAWRISGITEDDPLMIGLQNAIAALEA